MSARVRVNEPALSVLRQAREGQAVEPREDACVMKRHIDPIEARAVGVNSSRKRQGLPPIEAFAARANTTNEALDVCET